MIAIKLQTAARIELAVAIVFSILTLPFSIPLVLLRGLSFVLQYVIDWRDKMQQRIGHQLFLHSDVVRDGTVKNSFMLRNWTARWAIKEIERMGTDNPNLK